MSEVYIKKSAYFCNISNNTSAIFVYAEYNGLDKKKKSLIVGKFPLSV